MPERRARSSCRTPRSTTPDRAGRAPAARDSLFEIASKLPRVPVQADRAARHQKCCTPPRDGAALCRYGDEVVEARRRRARRPRSLKSTRPSSAAAASRAARSIASSSTGAATAASSPDVAEDGDLRPGGDQGSVGPHRSSRACAGHLRASPLLIRSKRRCGRHARTCRSPVPPCGSPDATLPSCHSPPTSGLVWSRDFRVVRPPAGSPGLPDSARIGHGGGVSRARLTRASTIHRWRTLISAARESGDVAQPDSGLDATCGAECQREPLHALLADRLGDRRERLDEPRDDAALAQRQLVRHLAQRSLTSHAAAAHSPARGR